jgi:hypothetical protein
VTLAQHDLLRLLESLRSADGLELVRGVAERMLQGADRGRGHREDRRGVERAPQHTHRFTQRPPGQDADHPGRPPGTWQSTTPPHSTGSDVRSGSPAQLSEIAMPLAPTLVRSCSRSRTAPMNSKIAVYGTVRAGPGGGATGRGVRT